MKKFSQIAEAAFASIPQGVVPGNLNNGVMNHYIPIENIVINVRNIFAPWFGLVVEPGEDGQSLKVYNSTFCSDEAVNACLYFSPDGRTCLADYVAMQGLPIIRKVQQGNTIVVYFVASDIAGQQDPATFATPTVKEPNGTYVPADMPQVESYEEELHTVVESTDDETEMKDIINRTFYDLAGEAGENKSDEKWAAALNGNIELPDGYYWAVVKDEDGHKSIALRKKVTKRLSFGRSKKYVVSLINIYNNGKNAIWVSDFDHKETIPTTDVELIESILSFIGAVPTKDACVYTFDKPALDEPIVVGDKVSEGKETCQLNTLYTVYDNDGQPIQSFTLESDAKNAAEKFAKDNKVKCKVVKETI